MRTTQLALGLVAVVLAAATNAQAAGFDINRLAELADISSGSAATEACEVTSLVHVTRDVITFEPAPTVTPTEEPTEAPTVTPTEEPTEAPTVTPTEEPTEAPTVTPTEEPTEAPTVTPTEEPTEAPTVTPTEEPTEAPIELIEVVTSYIDGIEVTFDAGPECQGGTASAVLVSTDGAITPTNTAPVGSGPLQLTLVAPLLADLQLRTDVLVDSRPITLDLAP